MQRLLDELTDVVAVFQPQIRRQCLADVLRLRTHGTGDLQRVRARLPDDAEAHHQHTISFEDRASLIRAERNTRHLAKTNLVAIFTARDDQPLKVLHRAILAVQPDRELPVQRLHRSRRWIDVFNA